MNCDCRVPPGFVQCEHRRHYINCIDRLWLILMFDFSFRRDSFVPLVPQIVGDFRVAGAAIRSIIIDY